MEHTEAKQAMKELTMMLIYLSRFCEREKFAEAKHFYAWKGYDSSGQPQEQEPLFDRNGQRVRPVTARKVRY